MTIYTRSSLPDHALRSGLTSGRLVRVRRGIYAEAGKSDHLVTTCRALCRHDRQAVILGSAAAALTWWPGLEVRTIEAWRGYGVAPNPGFLWTHRLVPDEHVLEVAGLRVSDPALTVLDLIPGLGGAAIDEALRRRATSLDELKRALTNTPRRRGNPERVRLLDDSRDEPWSEAERHFHRIIRGLRLTWAFRTNHRVELPSGAAFVDVALPTLKLGFEIDGYAYHSSRRAFERDRTRDVELSLCGWLVHRFSASMVADEAERVRSTALSLVLARAKSIRNRSEY